MNRSRTRGRTGTFCIQDILVDRWGQNINIRVYDNTEEQDRQCLAEDDSADKGERVQKMLYG